MMDEPPSEPTAQPQTPPKPLHVQVAEALGHRSRYREWWDDDERQNVRMPCWCETGFPAPGPVHHRHWEVFETTYDTDGNWEPCRFYNTDWSATGPLIEKLQMRITPKHFSSWEAELLSEGVFAAGPTLLVAACRLIVALAAATPTGKLELGGSSRPSHDTRHC